MHNHNREEDRVEPRKRRIEACNQTPAYREEPVACVVDFAGDAVYNTIQVMLVKDIAVLDQVDG